MGGGETGFTRGGTEAFGGSTVGVAFGGCVFCAGVGGLEM